MKDVSSAGIIRLITDKASSSTTGTNQWTDLFFKRANHVIERSVFVLAWSNGDGILVGDALQDLISNRFVHLPDECDVDLPDLVSELTSASHARFLFGVVSPGRFYAQAVDFDRASRGLQLEPELWSP